MHGIVSAYVEHSTSAGCPALLASRHLLDDLAELAHYHHYGLFFFKQKTAYEIGLGIPAEPLFRSRNGERRRAPTASISKESPAITGVVEMVIRRPILPARKPRWERSCGIRSAPV